MNYYGLSSNPCDHYLWAMNGLQLAMEEYSAFCFWTLKSMLSSFRVQFLTSSKSLSSSMEWLRPQLLASSNQWWVVLRTRDRYPLVINLGIYTHSLVISQKNDHSMTLKWRVEDSTTFLKTFSTEILVTTMNHVTINGRLCHIMW
jgi:hypothetical protein